jgi:membrane-bound metal-dependent hydrolase YbcI (DUF457 family)
MPFTPFHFGPGLLFGLLLLSYIDFPTFMLAGVIVDVEPILVLYLDLRYPLHGFLHSFLGGAIAALLLSAAMIRMRPVFSHFMSFFRLEQEPSRRSVFMASILGIYLHIFLDSFLYWDIRPFYPFSLNPVLNPGLSTSLLIYGFCAKSFIGGIVAYLVKLFLMRRASKIERD